MTIRIPHIIILSMAFGVMSISAGAAPSKISSGMGHDLAQTMCTSCHLIEPGQKNPPDHVGGPSFQTIADRPDTTAAKLREHLRTTHTNAMIPLAMPNPQLSRDQLNKIIDYLLTLNSGTKR